MMRWLRRNAFWKLRFDSAVERGLIWTRCYDCRALRETKYYWRQEMGQLRGLSPEEAAFRAFEDYANQCRKEWRDDPDADTKLQDLANVLESVAPWTDEHGAYIERKHFLSEPWLTYLEQYRERRRQTITRENAQEIEIAQYRFPREELALAWDQLVAGNIPPDAMKVWAAAFPRKSAHDISGETGVSVRDVVFWAVLFRENSIMEEHPFRGGSLFVRGRILTSTLPPRDRPAAQAAVIAALSSGTSEA